MAATVADRATTDAPAPPQVLPVREVTHEEGLVLLDRRARRRLGISGAEFLRRWEAGVYAADPDQPGVVDVAMLLPFVGVMPDVPTGAHVPTGRQASKPSMPRHPAPTADRVSRRATAR